MDLSLEDHCVAMAADGASVNFGSKGGVLTLMQIDIPWMVKMHCVAHRLELALGDAFKKTYCTEIDTFLMDLYYLMKRSAKKWGEFTDMAEALHEHVLKPVRAQGTRWLDHRRKALNVLDKDYVTVVSYLEDVGSGVRKDIPPADAAKMRGYLKKLKSYKFVLYFGLYKDLVNDLATLSINLQSNKIGLSEVRSSIETTLVDVALRKSQHGPHLEEVLNETEQELTFRGQKLSSPDAPASLAAFTREANDLVDKIETSVRSRFESLDDPILKASNIFDPKNIPDIPDIPEYGNNELKSLTSHFSVILEKNGCQLKDIPREWTKLKFDMKRNYETLGYNDFCQKILVQKQNRYPNICHVISIVLVCPVATAHVERMFSFIKRFLGDWRLALKLETINDLLRICTDGPEPIQFNPEKTLERWLKSSKRRVNTSGSKFLKCAEIEEHSDSDSEDDDETVEAGVTDQVEVDPSSSTSDHDVDTEMDGDNLVVD